MQIDYIIKLIRKIAKGVNPRVQGLAAIVLKQPLELRLVIGGDSVAQLSPVKLGQGIGERVGYLYGIVLSASETATLP